ncbi:MAG: putative Glyoxalase/bleomycin resistance protein/dioxygenase [Verrucomicrobiaceae bacterium]|nr:putative Glyoxalase/bleomycin resistance protein/dioxygenase [Verrucomicrobiaceae bacterium]
MAEILINIDVGGIDSAINFYTAALGLQLGRRLFDGTVAEMLGASSKIYLLLKSAGSLPSAEVIESRNYHRHWTPVHINFVVEDIDAAIKQAQAAGAKLESEPQSFAWEKLATLSDPFGHGLCLVQWLGAGYDEIA